MKVFFVASECTPLIKIGGLADVAGSLPKALLQQSIKPVIIIPGNSQIKVSKYQSIKVLKGIVYSNKEEEVVVRETMLPDTDIPVYLIENDHYLSYSNVYETGEGYTLIDRFAFFSLAALELISTLVPSPNSPMENQVPSCIIHCHDWHTALIPFLVKQKQLAFKTILTIHNLGKIYQGITDEGLLRKININSNTGNKVFNILEQGIENTDIITTVSPTYAQEILTSEYGEGLENTLKTHQQKLYGVLNGIDTDYWNPETDKYISVNYSILQRRISDPMTNSPLENQFSKGFSSGESVSNWQDGKLQNKIELLKSLNLLTPSALTSAVREGQIPVFGVVGRVAGQKGFDILITALEKILSKHDIRAVILATGDKGLEHKIEVLEKKHHDKLRFSNRFDEVLSHRIYAGSDFVLVPSKYEPCGLTQMIAMRYGSLPVVRKTGGLADTVVDCQTGFVFEEYSSEALLKKMEFAISSLNAQNPLIPQMIQNAMQQDFSWNKSAGEYVNLYNEVLR